MILPLTTNELTLYYDDARRVRYIIYGTRHSLELIKITYHWTLNLTSSIGSGVLAGSVIDYTRIGEFEAGNLAAIRENYRRNAPRYAPDYRIAIIVSNMQQEQMARMSLFMAGMGEDGRVVRSLEAALKFVNPDHANYEISG